MDLDVVLKSHDCADIVKCLGYFISDSDVWICMELMSMCFDKLLKLVKQPIPEEILGKMSVSVILTFRSKIRTMDLADQINIGFELLARLKITF